MTDTNYVKKTLEITKRKKLPDHYVQDIDYILYNFIETVRVSRARQHTNVLRIPHIHERLRALIEDAKVLHSLILEAK